MPSVRPALKIGAVAILPVTIAGLIAITPFTPDVVGDIIASESTPAETVWWREEDFAVVDNMLAAHGRTPYRGPRRVLVAMCDPFCATVDDRRNAEAPCLTRSEMIFYWDSVLGAKGGANWRDKYIIPLLETDYSALPPAFITAAAYDPLYDDAIVYGERLKAAGVEVAIRREASLTHSYMRARHVSPACRAGFAAIVSAIGSLAHEGCLADLPYRRFAATEAATSSRKGEG